MFKKSEEEKAAEEARKQAEEEARRQAAEAADQQRKAVEFACSPVGLATTEGTMTRGTIHGLYVFRAT